ncbi:MAG: hypothetical protein COB65_02920 [Thalassobium sp.]|nr:MAG: hypothetical protein COB65_02920 [Thalassobium sp.]
MNPYDAIGKAHNKGLDFIVEKLNPQEEIKYERIVELASDYLVSLKTGGKHEDCNDMKEDFIFGYVAVGKTMNLLSSYSTKELMTMGEFNQKQICFIESVLNVSDERDLDREGTLKILMNIEEQMLKSDLTAKELEIPLITVSIAKYSVKYFMEQIKSGKSEWINFLGKDLAKLKWPWKADGKGAVGGALGGIAGGAGGVILGGIGGALGSSVAAALGLS